MKQILLTTALAGSTALVAGTAVAGSYTPPPAEPVILEPVAPPVFDWTGGFVGLQFGYIDTSVDNDFGDIEDDAGNVFDDINVGSDADGSTGGIYGGYNWQNNSPWVYGFDAEYNWVDANGDGGFSLGDTDGSVKADVDGTGAIRGRVGYAWNRTLLYATAGLAYITYSTKSDVGGDTASSDGDSWGYTLGVGLEQAFTDRWVGRIDYRYSNFDSDNGTFEAFDRDDDYSVDLDTSEIRLGLAYRF